jgi:EAL domain-containing protein (putative c-di-GMP-specific phosphodiesterase class I)/signal transduction histidine kinase/DNA-binding response OmpR family regulator
LAQSLGKRRTVRSKLFVLVLASVGLAVSLVAGVTTWRDANRDAAVQSQRLVSATSVLASLSVRAAAADDRGQAFAAIRAVALMPEVRYARIETASGALLAETGAGARLSTDARIEDLSQAPSFWSLMRSHTIQASAPIMQTGRRVGRVIVVGQVSGEAERVGQSLLISLVAALIAAGAGLGVAWRLQRGISEPIQALTRAVGQIRETHDYGRRAEVAADDEVADLVSGFNGMLDEIRVRDAALADHLASLEQTVAERTADLVVAKETAEAATNAKSDFLATMSHEIRTPMNGIMVMAEMLAAGEIPPRQRRFAEVIAKSGSSLLAIINDILDFSKIEAGKLELEAAPVDLADVAEDVCSLFWERARAKGLDLAAYVDPATPKLISADEVRLRQVVGNLVNNAIKFTETGGVLVQIEPRAAKPGETASLRIAVHDTGIGIPKDKLGAVFGAFSQADQSTTRKFGGTGLGLAICKRLVEAMDGRIGVTSQVGKGSVFSVDIPITVIEPAEPWPVLEADRAALALAGLSSRHAMGRYLARAGLKLFAWVGENDGEGGLLVGDPAALGAAHAGFEAVCVGEYGDSAPEAMRRDGLVDAVLVQPFRRRDLKAFLAQRQAGAPIREVSPETAAASEALPHFAGARVLVADDSAVNREVAIEALSRLGVTADVVADGVQAVEAALKTGFDLILMDGSMPEMDGYDAAREIRRRQDAEGLVRIPIVALTAHVVGQAAEAWREAGMDAVLHKPFTLASLARTLGQYLTPTGEAEAPGAAPKSSIVIDSNLLDAQVHAEMETMAAGGRADFVERVRRLYRDNAPACVTALEAAVEAGDADEAARAAHALKSMSLNIGARAVSDLAARIEVTARDQNQVDAEGIAAIGPTLTATLAALEGRTPVEAPAAPPAPRTPESLAERQLLADLEQAIGRGEFTLAYQPQVDRGGETIIGVEALLRWNHPVRGAVSPALFIPLAEQHGLIGQITPWVAARAMRETAELAPLQLSINASALEFNDPGFADRLASLVAEQGFDPQRLEVEITETAILKGEDEVRRGIERLRAMGIKIALDDFGVGYSSLSHLRLFPFDKLKIDRLFITSCSRDAESATVVHGVISIGRALGMKVVAEGVETETQFNFLKVAGVHAMQGYLTGRPMPVDALKILLEAQKAKSAA